MAAMKSYEDPSVKVIGSVRDLTQAPGNKVGSNPDAFSAVTNGAIVGSIVPIR